MKMIKTITGLFAVFCLSLSLSAFAAPALSGLKASQRSGGESTKALRSAAYSRTDVHVFNNSSQPIWVEVPKADFLGKLNPGIIEDFTSDDYYDAVRIVLSDMDGFVFFDQYVPNHLTVEVTDCYGARAVNSSKPGAKVQATIKK